MRCIQCQQDGLALTTQTCPSCGVHFPSLFRDFLPPGTHLRDGAYRIDYPLARGGFGIIYQAVHTALEHHVSIKEFCPDKYVVYRNIGRQLHVDSSQRHAFTLELQQFMQEGKILASLHHQGIVRVQDLFEENGTAYLVMELLRGQTLRQLLEQSHGQLSTKRVQTIVSELVVALEILHKAEVYHLDIKPENVFITSTPEERIVLMDFGAARRKSSGPGIRQFDLDYTAPEVLDGDAGPQSDLFELGMMTHELLTGKRPPSAVARSMEPLWTVVTQDKSWQVALTQALTLSQYKRPQSVQTWWQTKEQRHRSTLTRRAFLIGGTGALATTVAVLTTTSSVRDSLFKILLPLLPSAAILFLPVGTTIYTYKGHISPLYCVSWSHNDRLIASAGKDGLINIWDAFNGKTSLTYKGRLGAVYTVQWSSDNKYIASAGDEHVVRVWDASSGKTLLTYKGHSSTIYTAQWSPDNMHIASAGNEHTVKVWNASSGKTTLTYKGHSDMVAALAWAPDGKHIISTGKDHAIKIWNVVSGKTLLTFKKHTDMIDTIEWSPDGKHIVTGGSDKLVKIWNAMTGQQELICRGHTSSISVVTWSPNGNYLASGSRDKTVRVWNATSGRQLYIYKGHTNQIQDINWCSDSKTIVSVSSDKTAQVWKAAN